MRSDTLLASYAHTSYFVLPTFLLLISYSQADADELYGMSEKDSTGKITKTEVSE